MLKSKVLTRNLNWTIKMSLKENNQGRAKYLLSSLQEYDSSRSRSLNLVASENVLSPVVRYTLSSDLASRYSSEVTRRGYKEKDMEKIAELIHRVIVGKEEPTVIKTEVKELASRHSSVEYFFTDIEDAIKL